MEEWCCCCFSSIFCIFLSAGVIKITSQGSKDISNDGWWHHSNKDFIRCWLQAPHENGSLQNRSKIVSKTVRKKGKRKKKKHHEVPCFKKWNKAPEQSLFTFLGHKIKSTPSFVLHCDKNSTHFRKFLILHSSSTTYKQSGQKCFPGTCPRFLNELYFYINAYAYGNVRIYIIKLLR